MTTTKKTEGVSAPRISSDTGVVLKAGSIAAVILSVIGIIYTEVRSNRDKIGTLESNNAVQTTEINHLKEQSRLQMEALNDVKDDTTSIKEALGRLESKLETP